MVDPLKKLGVTTTEAFIAGFWVAIGFNPLVKIGTVTIHGAAKATDYTTSKGFLGPSELISIIHLGVALTTIALLAAAVIYGRIPGLVGFGCAFVSGMVFLSATELALLLLITAYVCAMIGGLLYDSSGRGGGGRGGRSQSVTGFR